jgi:hypothetical protein
MYSLEQVLKFEDGEMDKTETVEFFSELVKCGDAWRLQGMYGRMASQLIDAGYLDSQGNMLDKDD